MEGDEVKEQIPHIQASTIRLADFWDSNPEAWLAFAESQFRRAGIKSELVKLDAVVEKLPLLLITKLTLLIAKPPKRNPTQNSARNLSNRPHSLTERNTRP